jgi:nucleoside-diphosphate-sugar epimerase
MCESLWSGVCRSHLVDRLMEQGHEVTVLDNLFTGSRVHSAPPPLCAACNVAIC